MIIKIISIYLLISLGCTITICVLITALKKNHIVEYEEEEETLDCPFRSCKHNTWGTCPNNLREFTYARKPNSALTMICRNYEMGENKE